MEQLSPRATTTESMCCNYRACMLQILKPTHLEPVPCNKKSHSMRSPRTATKSSPHLLQLLTAHTKQQRPTAAIDERRMKWKSLSRVRLFETPWDWLYSPWDSPGQNTGAGSRSLLQGIFPTQGLNPGLLCCRWILYQLSHQGSP